MRYLRVPEDVDVQGVDGLQTKGSKPLTFASFFVELVVPRLAQLQRDAALMRITRALVSKLDGVEAGGIVELRDDEHEKLEQCMPSDLRGSIYIRTLHFYEAVIGATKDRPADAVKPPAETALPAPQEAPALPAGSNDAAAKEAAE